MKKSIVFSIHSIAGLVSGLFILLMSLSGAILIFNDEVDGLQNPRVEKIKNASVLSVDSAYTCLQKKYPHAQISNVSLPGRSEDAFSFIIYDSSYQSGKKALQVFVHPQTGSVLKTGGRGKGSNNFISWLSGFHHSFHLGKTGEWLLGFCALVFLLSMITGIILFRKKIAQILLFRKNAFTRRNLHQVIGVYALLFNLMIAVTGFWMQRYVFKKTFYTVSGNYTRVFKPSPALFFNFDSTYKNLQQQYPDFTGSVVYFAQKRSDKTAIYGSRAGNSFIHSKKLADVIFLDSAGGISKTAFVTEINKSDRYDIINAQVHYGQYGGLTVKIIYSFFGLTGGLLSITGFLLWIRRRKQMLSNNNSTILVLV